MPSVSQNGVLHRLKLLYSLGSTHQTALSVAKTVQRMGDLSLHRFHSRNTRDIIVSCSCLYSGKNGYCINRPEMARVVINVVYRSPETCLIFQVSLKMSLTRSPAKPNVGNTEYRHFPIACHQCPLVADPTIK